MNCADVRSAIPLKVSFYFAESHRVCLHIHSVFAIWYFKTYINIFSSFVYIFGVIKSLKYFYFCLLMNEMNL